MNFYLGTHITQHMERTDVPLFVSRRRLARIRKKFPRAKGTWALDSGGFTELSMHGGWSVPAAEYVREVRRFRDEVGKMQWASPRDWMCEPPMLKSTGLSVYEHQRRTVDDLLDLRARAPDVRWVPVLQGWTVEEYLRCCRMYQRAGVDLRREPLVGVGTICRRQHTAEAASILSTLAGLGLRLHAYGLKLRGIERCAAFLASCDSLAWSLDARHADPLPGCSGHKNCANCLRYALEWRRKVTKAAGPHLLGQQEVFGCTRPVEQTELFHPIPIAA